MITQNFNIYLHAGIGVAPVVHASQYSQGETWTFTILDNDGSVYRPSSGALIGLKSDGRVIAGITGTVNADGSVSIVTTQQLTAAAGRGVFELTIDGGTNGTANFIVEVEKKPTDGGVLSESDLSIIQQGINSVTPAVINETVSDYLAEHMTNPPIDPTLTVSNAAADAQVVGNEITDLKTAIDEIRTSGTKNICNDDIIASFDGISVTNNVFSGTANKFEQNVLLQTGFDSNTQYTISLYGKNTGANTSGYGLGIRIDYDNDAYGTSFFQNSQTSDFGRLIVTSEAGRTISSVAFEYNSGGDNVWEIKNIQIEKGTAASDYVPYFTGFDRIAREKADSNTASIALATAEIYKTDNTITKIETALGKSANLFDKSSAENGKYYSGSTGNAPELKPDASYCAIMIDVKPNTTYIRNYADFSSYEINSDGLVTGSLSATTFTTTATTKAITLSVTLAHKDDFMIAEGSVLPESYEPYGAYMNIQEQERVYEVGTGKPFTTFTACLEALQGNSQQKTILVYAGTYDIFEEIGGAEYAATISAGTNWRDVSIVVPPNTKIIGVGDVVFEFLPESSEMPAPACSALSALNVSGNVEIENIKIKAKNCHYCIHDETSSLADFNNVTHKYKNVECIKYSGDGDAQAYAAGFQQGGKYDFESCLFKSEIGKAFSMHNSSTGGATINIKNCVMITTTATVAVDFINVSGQQVRNITNLCGCYFENDGGNKRLSITGGDVNTFDVTCISCTDVGDTTVDIAGNIYPIKQYNKFSVN